MTHFHKPSLTSPVPSKPIAMVGAGRLTSMIWKNGDQRSGWRYSFNLFRLASQGGRVSQLFKPTDVIHFVKLAQVLAAVIADDGCLTQVEAGALKRLANDLDQLLKQASYAPNAATEEVNPDQGIQTPTSPRHQQ